MKIWGVFCGVIYLSFILYVFILVVGGVVEISFFFGKVSDEMFFFILVFCEFLDVGCFGW